MIRNGLKFSVDAAACLNVNHEILHARDELYGFRELLNLRRKLPHRQARVRRIQYRPDNTSALVSLISGKRLSLRIKPSSPP